MSRALVAVSKGDRFNRQTERMIDDFHSHNDGWETCWYHDEGLDEILPPVCRTWTPFNKCEIGRWFAMGEALQRHDRVLYCDGDMAWYGEYRTTDDHGMVLSPHYFTRQAKRNARHFLFKDGVPNIGIIEMGRSDEHDDILMFVIEEVLANPQRHMHGEQLWLQNIVTVLPDCGYDVVYNGDIGCNVAFWNLRTGDRTLVDSEDGVKVVTADGREAPLVSFHFSAKSIRKLERFGETARRLRDDYIRSQVVEPDR